MKKTTELKIELEVFGDTGREINKNKALSLIEDFARKLHDEFEGISFQTKSVVWVREEEKK